MIDELRRSCTVLLARAFEGRTLAMFGEDGCGKYGTSPTPLYAKVRHVGVTPITPGQLLMHPRPMAEVELSLTGYSAAIQGVAITDENLRISINTCLADEHIRPDSWEWGSFADQGDTFISLNFDLKKLDLI